MANNVLIVDAANSTRNVAALDIGSGSELLAQEFSQASPSAVSSSLGSLNASVIASVSGMGSVAFTLQGTYTGTVAFEACFDATQTTWYPLFCSRLDTASVASATTSTGVCYTGACDGGMTFVRVRMSAYTSGAVTAVVAPSGAAIDPTPSILLAGASSTRIGSVMASGLWNDDTSTALAANAVYTGTSRDIVNATTGSGFSSAANPAEFRVSAESDVGGTLYVEVSRDNVTWRRIKGQAAAQFDTSSVFYSEIIHKPSTRWVRPVYVNGAAVQTHFMVQEIILSLV